MYLSIYNQNIACDHGDTKMGHLHFGCDLRMITWWYIDSKLYYYVERLKVSSTIWWLFKIETLFGEIETFVNHWGQYIFSGLENCGHASDEHVGRLSEVIWESGLL